MRLYPDMLRLVLSGQSDLESVVKSAGVTHQYLSKPCSIELMRDAVNRAVALHQLLANSALKQLLSRLHSIPSVPPLYVELMAAVKSNEATLEKVSAIIQKDMGMSAKVLQLANSALGAAGRMTSTADAVFFGPGCHPHAAARFACVFGVSAECGIHIQYGVAVAAQSGHWRLGGAHHPDLAGGWRSPRVHADDWLAARCGPSGAGGEPAGCLRAGMRGGRGETSHTLGRGTGNIRSDARRGGSVPDRTVGPAGADRGSSRIPPLAFQVPASRLCHVDLTARCRFAGVSPA